MSKTPKKRKPITLKTDLSFEELMKVAATTPFKGEKSTKPKNLGAPKK